MCNKFERLKAAQVATGIRDNERNGRAQLVIVEEGHEPNKLIEVTFDILILNSSFKNVYENYIILHYYTMKILWLYSTCCAV